MNFNQLNDEIKEKLSQEILSNAMSLGSKNSFLQMIEDIRKEEKVPLLHKSKNFKYSKGRISWKKSIYDLTLTTLFDAIKREKDDGDILKDISLKEYKKTVNMMKTLKPLNFTVKPKDSENSGFEFSIIDIDENNQAKVSFMFKIIFFYNIEFAKKALSYNKEVR